jgi:ADP-ribose pyrophosphatase YjhB (NUDIX family)
MGIQTVGFEMNEKLKKTLDIVKNMRSVICDEYCTPTDHLMCEQGNEAVSFLLGLAEAEQSEQSDVFPQVGVATIVFKDRATLLIGRAKTGPDAGKWIVPCGLINPFETIQQASVRVILEQTGCAIQAKQMLFLSEKITPPPLTAKSPCVRNAITNDTTCEHRLVMYCEGVIVDANLSRELPSESNLSEIRWVDPRELGLYQHEMSDMTVDAFYKYSLVLRARGAAGQV